jgi:hypothetical protein
MPLTAYEGAKAELERIQQQLAAEGFHPALLGECRSKLEVERNPYYAGIELLYVLELLQLGSQAFIELTQLADRLLRHSSVDSTSAPALHREALRPAIAAVV